MPLQSAFQRGAIPVRAKVARHLKSTKCETSRLPGLNRKLRKKPLLRSLGSAKNAALGTTLSAFG